MHDLPGPVPIHAVTRATLDRLWELAYAVLRGVGDLGHQFVQLGEVAVHVRRRLTAVEAQGLPIAWGTDLRGTPAGRVRLARVARYLPPGWSE